MKEKRNPIFSGWLAMAAGIAAVLLIVLGLAGSAQAAFSESQPAAAVLTTATMTATQPAKGTPAAGVSVLPDGFDAWCAPQAYALTKPTGPEAPAYARKLAKVGEKLNVPIPGAYCVLSFTLDKPVPEGTVLTMYDSKSPFLRLPVQAAEGKPEVGWTTVKHSWVVNPPKWSVSYGLSLTGPNNEELWASRVSFVRPLPRMCPFGGYPDPVTMYCTPTDPWEIEPHPDAKYPYPRTPRP